MRLSLLVTLLLLSHYMFTQPYLDLQWAHTAPGKIESVCSDNQGFHYFTGTFSTTADFDPGTGTFNITPAGLHSIYVQKLDDNSNFAWAKSYPYYGLFGMPEALKIVSDKAGHIYLAGNFRDSIDFNPGNANGMVVSNGLKDFFVMKLDYLGNMIWVNSFGGSGDDLINDIEVDAKGRVYLSGSFENSVDFDPGMTSTIRTSNGDEDYFIQKLNAAGNLEWVLTGGGALSDKVTTMTIDYEGHLIVAGNYSDTIDLDPGPGIVRPSSIANNKGGFILKLTPDKNFVWLSSLATLRYVNCVEMHTRSNGDIFIGGEISFNMSIITPSSNQILSTGTVTRDVFAIRMDKNGTLSYVKSFGADFSDDLLKSMAIDEDGNAYFTGSFRDSVDFDPGPGVLFLKAKRTPTFNSSDIFISRLDKDGDLIWAYGSGDFLSDQGVQIKTFGTNQLIAIGNFEGQMDADPDSSIELLNSSSSHQSYAIKFGQNSCPSLVVKYDSVKTINCTDTGFASVYVKNGIPPYTYSWNTTPATNDSIAYFPNSGIYEVSITDGRNCTATSKILMNGPYPTPGFDLDIYASIGILRTGFNGRVDLNVFNENCTPQTAKVHLVLDPKVTYLGATNNGVLKSNDTVEWNPGLPLFYNSGNFSPYVLFNVDTSAQISDTLCFTTIVYPIDNDTDSTNNIKTFCREVVQSYDPNDKRNFPEGKCAEKYLLIDETISYIIRFQNTGNIEAINVFVTDTLDPALDISTVRVTGSSHEMYTEVLDNNTLKFHFDDIYLPDSTSNEPESHGIIYFDVQPKSDAPDNTLISNDVQIFFDYNEAVYTNEVKNVLVKEMPPCAYVGVKEIFETSDFMIYPNPVSSELNILNTNKVINRISVIDITGKVRIQKSVNFQNIETKELSPGIYLLLIEHEGQQTIRKFIKNSN